MKVLYSATWDCLYRSSFRRPKSSFTCIVLCFFRRTFSALTHGVTMPNISDMLILRLFDTLECLGDAMYCLTRLFSLNHPMLSTARYGLVTLGNASLARVSFPFSTSVRFFSPKETFGAFPRPKSVFMHCLPQIGDFCDISCVCNDVEIKLSSKVLVTAKSM